MRVEVMISDGLYQRLCGLAIKARMPVEDLAEKMLEKRAIELEKEWKKLEAKND